MDLLTSPTNHRLPQRVSPIPFLGAFWFWWLLGTPGPLVAPPLAAGQRSLTSADDPVPVFADKARPSTAWGPPHVGLPFFYAGPLFSPPGLRTWSIRHCHVIALPLSVSRWSPGRPFVNFCPVTVPRSLRRRPSLPAGPFPLLGPSPPPLF